MSGYTAYTTIVISLLVTSIAFTLTDHLWFAGFTLAGCFFLISSKGEE